MLFSELLKEHGFTEVMVNVSHLAEEIENYFRDGQRFGVEIAYSFEGIDWGISMFYGDKKKNIWPHLFRYEIKLDFVSENVY